MTDEEKQREGSVEEVLRQVSSQLRYSLGNIHSALERIAPAEARDGDEGLDMNAAILCQSYYRILRLTNNLSDAVDLDAPSQARLSNDDIVGICRDVVRQAEAPAELAGLELTFCSDKSGHIISVDAERIKRLLLNLLSNAFKYTPKGGRVSVEVRVDQRWVELAVSDTGRGIPAEAMETVFERYLHPPLLDGLPHGLGLGLPICRRIAGEHGGRLILTSREGEGTTVTVSLPNRRERAQKLNAYTVADGGGFNPILVELSDALPKQAFTQKYLD